MHIEKILTIAKHDNSIFTVLLQGRCVCVNLGTFFCLLKVSDLNLYKCPQCWTKIYYVPYLLQSCKTGNWIMLLKMLIFSLLFYHFPQIDPKFLKIASILSPIFLLEATWSPGPIQIQCLLLYWLIKVFCFYFFQYQYICCGQFFPLVILIFLLFQLH